MLQQEILSHAVDSWKTRKPAKSRTPKNKKVTIDRKALQLACFNRKPSAVVQNVEKETAEWAAHHLVKCKIKISALAIPSLDYMLTCDAVFEKTWIYLTLSDYLHTTDVENLNKSSKVFAHLRTMILHTELNIFLKL